MLMSERRSLPVLLYPRVGFMSMWSGGCRITQRESTLSLWPTVHLTDHQPNLLNTRFIQHVEGITINIFKNLNFGVFVRVCVEKEREGEIEKEGESVCGDGEREGVRQRD